MNYFVASSIGDPRCQAMGRDEVCGTITQVGGREVAVIQPPAGLDGLSTLKARRCFAKCRLLILEEIFGEHKVQGLARV